MGTLLYGAAARAHEFDDRTLAHLKYAITVKLLRHESFVVSWMHPPGVEGGRSTIWMSPAIPLEFIFDTPEPPELNREWVEQLLRAAGSLGGIQVSTEPPTPAENENGHRPDRA